MPGMEDARHSVLMEFLTDNTDMKKAAQSGLKQGMVAGGAAFAGAVLLGPVGGLIGGVAGSVAGFLTSDQYDGVVLAAVRLESGRRDRLVKEVASVLVGAGAKMRSIEDAGAFREALLRYADQDAVRDGIWRACVNSASQ